jgi:hypothetical protein
MNASPSLSTDVPSDAALADLDESIRRLLKRDLARHQLDVEITFDAPNKEWAAALNSPTINAFLYDIREAKSHRPVEWGAESHDGQTSELRPPLMLEATYAVSAWARAVEDEHRLLSQLLAILYAYPQLPAEILAGALLDQPYPLSTTIARPQSDVKADFWSSVGGTFKASLDYAVTLACDSGTTLSRGAEVRTQTVQVAHSGRAHSSVAELHRTGGMVRSAGGEPIADAWVALPDAGRFTTSGPDGRFRFDRLTAGTYECHVRTLDGAQGTGTLIIPGTGIELTPGNAVA